MSFLPICFPMFNETTSQCYLKALEDSIVYAVNKNVAEASFENSHQLERFGRLSMQEAFLKLFHRVERMTVRSNEERYLRLLEKAARFVSTSPQITLLQLLGHHSCWAFKA